MGTPGARPQPARQEEAGRASKEERKMTKKTRVAGGGGMGVIPDLLNFLSIPGENQKLMVKGMDCEPSEEEGQELEALHGLIKNSCGPWLVWLSGLSAGL